MTLKITIGERYGFLNVISLANPAKNGSRQYLCVCECGNLSTVQAANLFSGHTKSCGCFQKIQAAKNATKHGLFIGSFRPKIYNIWAGIKQRCENPNSPFYHRYGGRGITMCKEWSESFEIFFKDMGQCPDNFSIDRIDNNKGYYKENCRWASQKTQCRNTSSNRLFEWHGKTMSLAELCETHNLPQGAVGKRLKRGWSLERSLMTPLR